MSLAAQTGVLILTYNEEPNIARTLAKLAWAKRILIVDSGSTDATLAIARQYPQVEIVSRPFDDFAGQCNFGLSCIGTDWVLSLDADYELSDALVAELMTLEPDPAIGGYRAPFIYRIDGTALRGTLYPARTVLYRKEGARYRNEGHGHRVGIAGDTRQLESPIYHDDRKPLARWFASQQSYARIEAAHLMSADKAELRLADRIRLLTFPAPFAAFLYALFVKRALLDGRAGLFYAFQRMLAETMIALEIIGLRLSRTRSERGEDPQARKNA